MALALYGCSGTFHKYNTIQKKKNPLVVTVLNTQKSNSRNSFPSAEP
jgi:hypothetical protein